MKFKVVLHDTKDGLAVSCPELPGCYSQGRTEEEALENIQEAILCHLTALAKVNRAQSREEVDGSGMREIEIPLDPPHLYA